MAHREQQGSAWKLRLLWITFAIGLALGAGSAFADDDSDSDSDSDSDGAAFCSTTAGLQHTACKHEVRDDYYVARAICLNVGDEDERDACFDDAGDERAEAHALCRDQRDARLEVCGLLGEDRYDPDFDPDLFDHDFTALTHPNPYRPLAIGSEWHYESEDETVTVRVLDETKLIDGVTCIVVNDVVEEDGEVREDTDDWFAQRLDGTVDYCGEIVTDFESFDGDDPAVPELVAIDGSFKAGRDGDQSGTLFPGTPVVGDSYRQEWSASNAEDLATVLATDYSYGDDPVLDAFVPEDLADLLCADGDCVVTAEFTPLEPGVLEHKYYARGIGLFLEVKPDDGEISQLVDCNVDPRCAFLPAP